MAACTSTYLWGQDKNFDSWKRGATTFGHSADYGLKTLFLLKVLPHSDKVRYDFFHLEKTYIQDTHTPTREEGRQVNVFSDHAADFTSIKGFNTS